MGATSVTLSYPGKTLEQAKKLYGQAQDQDLYENGHSYSGGPGMLDSGRVTSLIFESMEHLQDWFMAESIDKGRALWVQVKVIRSTKPLEAADLKMREANKTLWAAQREKKAPSVIRTLQKRQATAKTRYDKIYSEQAKKSNKTSWVVVGWASS